MRTDSPLAFAITVGAGRARPQGRRLVLGASPSVAALARTLGNLEAEVDGWWTPHLFRTDHRCAANWEGSAALVADVDFYDAEGKHAGVPENRRQAFETRLDLFASSLYHSTPRGARFVLVLSAPMSDPARYKQRAKAYALCLQSTLEVVGLAAQPRVVRPPHGAPVRRWHSGFVVDEAVSTDLARLLFRPNARVDGDARDALFQSQSEEPVDEGVVARWGKAFGLEEGDR